MEEKASFWSRTRFLIVVGVGFLADGCLNDSIGLVVPMLGYIYFKDNKGKVPASQGGAIKGGLSLGMIVGQLMFGFLGDTLGRHKIYGRELLFTLFGTLMCILLPWKGISHDGIVAWMAVWRVVTGLGIGGDYPMSSALAAENAPMGSRAKLVLSAFFIKGIGEIMTSVSFLVLLAAFKNGIQHNVNRLEWVWRLLFGIALIPGALTVYARFTMKETKPYVEYVQNASTEGESKKDRTFREQLDDFRVYFADWQHAKALFSLCAVWFLYDIASYGISLNQSIVLTDIGFATGSTTYDKLWNTAVGNLIVIGAGYLPGWFVGIFLPDWMGRKAQQFWFSLAAAVVYAIWAGLTNHASKGALITLFALSQFIQNAGTGITTFLLPVELFPTRVRATAHGLAAACGKVGAVITSFAFGSVTNAIGIRGVLGLFAGLMTICALLTALIPETKGCTLQDLEDDTLYKGKRISDRELSDTPTPSVGKNDMTKTLPTASTVTEV
ncbi:hypothetical protein PV11_04769 [Exophiala sideris]|uniref:Major facilitator superfamily (MFS) profile domain-containing protein n=1 Tax=Exophiala sideris TaxID=1016849 RepID=A0A0D1W1M2_9EURO|nr:hypothetical protein PV11_04769 [Exophiala sideris]